MKSSRAPVSVVIPTYNGLSLLQKYLPAVMNMVGKQDEVIVVDDASTDETVQWLNEQPQTQVRVLQNPSNLRFGASVNAGVTAAQHGLVLILNNDVKPQSDVLEKLVSFFDDPDIFAVGCHETQEIDGKKVTSGKNRLWFERGLFRHSRADEFKTGPTAWASGGSALFRKSMWEQLGGFHQHYYPAYWEDVDLSFRARQRGWKVYFCAEAKVEHFHETTNLTVFGQRRLMEMSWHHAQIFTLINGNLLQKLQFLIWWPYNQWQFRKLLQNQ